jgi:hypothetical protein
VTQQLRGEVTIVDSRPAPTAEPRRTRRKVLLSACQGPQIQHRRELAVHNCLALAPDEPKVISGALDSGRTVGPGTVSESANSELVAHGTTTDGKARSEELAARNHGCPTECPAYRIGTWRGQWRQGRGYPRGSAQSRHPVQLRRLGGALLTAESRGISETSKHHALGRRHLPRCPRCNTRSLPKLRYCL